MFVEGATNGFADPIRSSTGVKRWENITKDVKITIDGSLKEKHNVEVKKGFPDENNSGADVVLEDLCDVNNSLQQVMILICTKFAIYAVISVCINHKT